MLPLDASWLGMLPLQHGVAYRMAPARIAKDWWTPERGTMNARMGHYRSNRIKACISQRRAWESNHVIVISLEAHVGEYVSVAAIDRYQGATSRCRGGDAFEL